jgi:hypothetical protein
MRHLSSYALPIALLVAPLPYAPTMTSAILPSPAYAQRVPPVRAAGQGLLGRAY